MGVLRNLLLVLVVCVFSSSVADKISIPKEFLEVSEERLARFYPGAKIKYFELYFSNGDVAKINHSDPVEISAANVELQKVVMSFDCPELSSAREAISSAREGMPDIVSNTIADYLLPSKIFSKSFRYTTNKIEGGLKLNTKNENILHINYHLFITPYFDDGTVGLNIVAIQRGAT